MHGLLAHSWQIFKFHWSGWGQVLVFYKCFCDESEMQWGLRFPWFKVILRSYLLKRLKVSLMISPSLGFKVYTF